MKTSFALPIGRGPRAFVPFLMSVGVACGGQLGGEAARSAAPTVADAGSASSPKSPAPADDASALSTTTSALSAESDAGEGSRLPEAPVAASSRSYVEAPKAPHTHDPGRGPADIRAIVLGRREEARACFDKALATHPGLEGDLVMVWTIDPKGNVTRTDVDKSRSQIMDPTLAACVSGVLKQIHFAPSPGGFETTASYPFNFHPRRGQPSP